ncbi:hypothetical protein AB1Y20_011057 [Prymnesium parvum]|uniref:Uncharacterized protein n=1 Tax=Prymnesium parvum TaxID=97485 RepID=A0AB34ILS6_PRYPA
MESLAEAAEAAGATPQEREEPVFEGATERDEACVIVGEKRMRSDAVTAMENKKEHLRLRLDTREEDRLDREVGGEEREQTTVRARSCGPRQVAPRRRSHEPRAGGPPEEK